MDIQVGDALVLKKPHPCGSFVWRVLRTGADIRIECEGCSHQLLLPRRTVEKSVREIRRS